MKVEHGKSENRASGFHPKPQGAVLRQQAQAGDRLGPGAEADFQWPKRSDFIKSVDPVLIVSSGSIEKMQILAAVLAHQADIHLMRSGDEHAGIWKQPPDHAAQEIPKNMGTACQISRGAVEGDHGKSAFPELLRQAGRLRGLAMSSSRWKRPKLRAFFASVP